MSRPDHSGDLRLLVFSDDWGRHPSSCQHLISRLLDDFQVYWVNTIGTRSPGIDLYTLRRGLGKLRSWMTSGDHPDSAVTTNPEVLSPPMWPRFRSRMERRLNRWLLSRKILQTVPEPASCVGITTLPLVADLVGTLPISRWIYYCVDDLAAWPGLDRKPLEEMERDLVSRADSLVAVSDHLVQHLAAQGRSAHLLTHGVDTEFWQRPAPSVEIPQIQHLPRPLVMFWGVIDSRMDGHWIGRLSRDLENGTIVLIGPEDGPPSGLDSLSNVTRPGPLPHGALPHAGRAADVLIMPYAQLEVTQAMQPLKLKEYLATGKPVVVSDLPAVAEWRDACDVATSADEFVDLVLDRIRSGLPVNQADARQRLRQESWSAKADVLRRVILQENS